MSIIENLGINWSVFVESEKALIEQSIKAGHHEHLAGIITQLSPEKVEEIQKIQKQLRPQAFTFESTQQKEFEVWLAKNGEAALNPAILEEWQAKIDAEKAEKLAQLTGDVLVSTSQSVDGTSKTAVITSNVLADLKGLGEASVEKLRAINVQTVEEFRAMPFEKKREILGGVVAANFKDFN